VKELFMRDIRLAFTSGNSLGSSFLLFLTVIVITPFAIGPSEAFLPRIGAGMIWLAILLAILLGLERLFQFDKEDGSLDAMMMDMDFTTLALSVFVKCLAHWASTVLPLVSVSPLLAILFHLDLKAISMIMLTLLLGTPAITFIGAMGAALTVTLPRGGVMLAVLVLPLAIPVIIFGMSVICAVTAVTSTPPLITSLLFLIALTLFFFHGY